MPPETDPLPGPSRESLASRYAELEHVDRALHEAEERLHAAHTGPAGRLGPRPEGLYTEVISLRAKSRRLLDKLSEMLLAAD